MNPLILNTEIEYQLYPLVLIRLAQAI
ncbi:uncharacterized protein METZ01_LOCUS458456, partial [marine metagenome]